MSYQALARKWRPQQFSELVGQDHIVRALRHALDQNQLHQALLFSGTRGIGKTTLGRLVAKGLNCEQGVSADPCGQCRNCMEISEGRFVDLIEVDAASRTGVDDTRELLENVQYAPAHGRTKVYLIDEVHMLSKSAFNALLKTLEEPPSHIQFLLATTDPQRLPITVLSRCLQFHLKRLPQAEIQQQLDSILDKEGISFEPAALSQLARAADGSMRDGLSLMDQAIAFGGGQVKADEVADMLGSIERGEVLALLQMLADKDAGKLPELINRLDEHAPDYNLVLDELASSLQQIALLQAIPDVPLDDDVQQHREAYKSLAAEISPEDAQLYYQIAVNGKRDMPYAPNPRAGFEMLVLRMLAFHTVLAGDDAGQSAVPAPPSDGSSSETKHLQTATRETTRARPPAKDEDMAVSDARTVSANRKPGVADGHEPPPASLNGMDLSCIDAQSWPQYAAQMPLRGLALELVRQCGWGQMTDGRMTLKLAPNLENLNRDRYHRQVQETLRKQSGQEIVLAIEVMEHDLPTAAQCDEQARAEQLREAEEALVNDPNVQALQERFGASIHPGSVEPQ